MRISGLHIFEVTKPNMISVHFRTAVLACLLTLPSATGAQTLDKIKNNGTVTIGYFDFQVPISYADASKSAIGYHIQVCEAIVEKAKETLGLSKLNIRYVPVTNASNVALLANGTIDLACGGQTHTADREQYVAFATTTYLSRIAILHRAAAPLDSIASLKGRSVVLSAGTLTSKRLMEISFNEGLALKLVPTKTPTEAFKLFEAGQADAYVASETTLAALVARTNNPSLYSISETPLYKAPWALMLRKNDHQFKQLADQTIAELFASGRIGEIYKRWFQMPIPPDGIVLNIPIRPELQRLFSHPTDSARPQDYE